MTVKLSLMNQVEKHSLIFRSGFVIDLVLLLSFINSQWFHLNIFTHGFPFQLAFSSFK